MKPKDYWDSSAVIAATSDLAIRCLLEAPPAKLTRPHTLAEVFSTITGGRLGFRVDPEDAHIIINEIAQYLEFISLTSQEIMLALANARKKGVRGGRVHDYLHAVAAVKGGCTGLLTLNINDFKGLFEQLELSEP